MASGEDFITWAGKGRYPGDFSENFSGVLCCCSGCCCCAGLFFASENGDRWTAAGDCLLLPPLPACPCPCCRLLAFCGERYRLPEFFLAEFGCELEEDEEVTAVGAGEFDFIGESSGGFPEGDESLLGEAVDGENLCCCCCWDLGLLFGEES